jgi:predicted RNase H-like HicB family nuclease
MGPRPTNRIILATIPANPNRAVRSNHAATNHPSEPLKLRSGPANACICQGPWWIGWIKELPGANCQVATREELLANLREALAESLKINREDTRRAAGQDVLEVLI